MQIARVTYRLGALLILMLVLEGCASSRATSDAGDPFEGMNRAFFAFNQGLDHAVLRPVAKGYVAILPQPARNGIHNALSNFFLPITFANDLLQGEVGRGAQTVARFAINSTIGVGGLVDVANRWGISPHTEDFGQTLAVWGLQDGPYLVLPILGPSGVRDAVGDVTDIFLHPLPYTDLREKGWWMAGILTVDEVDLRSRNLDLIDQIEQGSADPYSAVRSIYRQSRDNEIRNGEPTEDLPEF
jgi:phospholipid-binding lipoprotein MlaA